MSRPPTRQPRISVIVPTYNRAALLAETLQRLCQCAGRDYEVVVVDQSPTQAAEVLRVVKQHPSIRYFHIAQTGLPNARNFGLSRVRAPLVLFCDDDVVPSPDLIVAHLGNYSHSGVGGVAGRVLGKRGSPSSQPRGHVGRMCRWTGNQTDRFDATSPQDVDHAQGCNMSFRKAALEQIGGFDNRFGGSAFLEETDVCLRVRRAGHRIVFEPTAELVHLKEQSGGCRPEDLAHWYFWYGHNYALLFLKNMPRFSLPLFLLFRIATLLKGAFVGREPGILVWGLAGMLKAASGYAGNPRRPVGIRVPTQDASQSRIQHRSGSRPRALASARRAVKALLFANDFPPVTSGIATYFYHLWRRLPPHEVAVVAPRIPGACAFDAQQGFPILRVWLPLSDRAIAKITKTLATVGYALRLALRLRPGKLHCGQVVSSGIAGWLASRLLRLPYVIYVYGSETARLGRGALAAGLMRKVLSHSQCVVCNSQYTAREFEAFGVPKAKLRVIYPGVDTCRFRPTPKDPPLVERYGLKNRQVLMTVARLDQRKGHDQVLRALAHLGERASQAVYLIVGTGREEPRLRQLASQLGLEGRVRFAGFVPDHELARYYNLCDVFVLPNRVTQHTPLAGDVEGFGISLLEAAACAKPVIGGRSGGATEAVHDGVTGLLVDPQSVLQIADAIHRLLSDADLAGRLGRQGRQRAQRSFVWSHQARQIEQIL